MQIEDTDRLTLSDPPRAPAGLPESVQRVARFEKYQARVIQEIDPGLDNFGVADRNLNPLLRIPTM